MIPLVVIRGDAGVGKDTLGAAVAGAMNGVSMGFADALKRMAGDIFGFSSEQLFGPSAKRNEPDPRLTEAELTAFKSRALRLCREWAEGLWAPMDNEFMISGDWYASCLKRAAEGPLSPRFVLQTLGTEWGRALSPTLWINHAVDVALELMEGGHTYARETGMTPVPGTPSPGCVVITDARFGNEVLEVKKRGGYAVNLLREDRENTTSTGVQGHASELSVGQMPSHYYDLVVTNNGKLDALTDTGPGGGAGAIIDLMTYQPHRSRHVLLG